jgi:phage tail-like protein
MPFGAVKRPAYTGGRFVLELDQKKPVGFVTSIDGGHFKADTVASIYGGLGDKENDFFATRYPGKPKYEDITITVGATMSEPFWTWIQSTIANKPERRDGALVAYDMDGKERSRRTFQRALISEVGFPALDASGKSGAFLTIKISPEMLTYQDGDGSRLKINEAKDELTKQKQWLVSNFRVEIDRMKGKSKAYRYSKVESFSLKHNVITNPVGISREARKEVGKVELPSLGLTFIEESLEDWMKWYDTAVVKGTYEDTNAAITYLANDQRTELMRIEFTGVGLTSLDIEKYEAGKDAVAKVKASFYVEGMTLKTGKGNA